MDNANDNPSQRKSFAVLHYRPSERKFTSSPSAPPQQQQSQHRLEDETARLQRSDAPSVSSFKLSSPMMLPKRKISNMINLQTSSPTPHSRSPSPPPSSPPLSPVPSLSQQSTMDDLDTEDEDPISPGLSPLAQHIGRVARPLLCELAAAAIEQDGARLQALGDVERRIHLVELNRRTTRAALEKVVLEWARELTESGGAKGEFVEVCRAAEEFQQFKFARLAFVEARIRGEVVDTSDDDEDEDTEDEDGSEDDGPEDDQDGGSDSFPPSDPDDDLNDADDSNSDHESEITHLRPPPRRVPYRKSFTTTTRTQPAELTHFSPNVYADTSIPSHLAYFVQGRYQHLTVPQPPTAFSNYNSTSTTNSSSAIPPETPAITTQIIDQAARFPLRIPNRHTGAVDALDLPPELAAAQDWESRFWVCRLNDWHAAQLHQRKLQPAKHVRHKWNRNEKEWLRGWVQRRDTAAGATVAATAAAAASANGADAPGGQDKRKEVVDEDVDAALAREWNAHAVTPDGWRKGLRRRDGPILREARKKL
ncbi:hypothetical protein HDK64DRAFT_339259 [Phyllosticta capitalensis]